MIPFKTKKINKIILIQPPAFVLKDKSDMNPNVPLGLAYIAAVLERKGYEVRLLDAFIEGLENEEEVDNERVLLGLTPSQIRQEIKDFSPQVVGVSSLFTMQRKNAHAVCKIAKEVDNSIITVMGGSHPSAEPVMVLQDPVVDFVVLGEGEQVIVDLLRYLEHGGDISEIDGLGFRSNSKIVINEKKKFIEDLDSIPFPARHLLPMDRYFQSKMSHGLNRRTPYASILTSRGCPFECTFCSTHKVWSKRYRARSAANVLSEIKYLVDTYGIKELLFEDDNMLLDKNRAHDIFDVMIKEKFDLIWRTPNGVAVVTLDEEMLDKMKASGCYQIGLGVESGNKFVLNTIIKKPVDLEKARLIVKYARKIGIEAIVFLVVGMPGETLEQMRDSFSFVRSLGLYNAQHVSIATPYPGSKLYDICKDRGYFKKDFDFDQLSIRKPTIDTENWNGEDVVMLISQERRKNYLQLFFKNPILFFKALIPERLKLKIRKKIKYKKAYDVYSGFKKEIGI